MGGNNISASGVSPKWVKSNRRREREEKEELAVPVWHSGLTKQQSAEIERVQKTALRIILGEDFTNYEVACTLFGVEPLEYRRVQLCLNFAKKDLRSERTMFSKTEKLVNTRNKQVKVKEFNCRTRRYERNSLPYLSKLLNKD